MSSPKTAFISGGIGGIGMAISESLAQKGFNLIVHGINSTPELKQSKLDQLSKNYKIQVQYLGFDLSDAKAIEHHMTTYLAKNHIDILINNAGIQHLSLTENFSLEQWNHVIQINLNSVFHLIKLCLPGMKARNYGRIINIASTHGLVSSVQKSAYVATKHAVLGLTKTVALENAKQDITCNTICPGFVLTPLVEKQIEIRAKERNQPYEVIKDEFIREKHPSGQFVQPFAIGECAAFLCSEAAKEIRGASIVLDGGWTIQ